MPRLMKRSASSSVLIDSPPTEVHAEVRPVRVDEFQERLRVTKLEHSQFRAIAKVVFEHAQSKHDPRDHARPSRVNAQFGSAQRFGRTRRVEQPGVLGESVIVGHSR